MAMVKLLASLQRNEDSKNVKVVSSRRYRPSSERGDVHWVRRFAKAGGGVVVSGDNKIRANLHEQAAFLQAGMITFFFDARWNQMPLNSKSAMLMQWWPTIVTKIAESKPGDFWEIPCTWHITEMRHVSPPQEAISKHREQGPNAEVPRRRKRRRDG